jgi:antitoxin PrlF
MVTSKLTNKSQTTIPQPVRAALGLHPGDEIAYRINGGQVVLTKVRRAERDAPFKDLRRNGTPKRTGKPMPTSEPWKPAELQS